KAGDSHEATGGSHTQKELHAAAIIKVRNADRNDRGCRNGLSHRPHQGNEQELNQPSEAYFPAMDYWVYGLGISSNVEIPAFGRLRRLAECDIHFGPSPAATRAQCIAAIHS